MIQMDLSSSLYCYLRKDTYIYGAHRFVVYFCWTLPLTPPRSPISNTSARSKLRFQKSKEMCSQFGWDTASGISREQFEDLVGGPFFIPKISGFDDFDCKAAEFDFDLMILIQNLCSTKRADQTPIQPIKTSVNRRLSCCTSCYVSERVPFFSLLSVILKQRLSSSESHRVFLVYTCAGDEKETTDEELRDILMNHSRHARGQLLQREEWRMWPTGACRRFASTSVTVSLFCSYQNHVWYWKVWIIVILCSSDVDSPFKSWLQALFCGWSWVRRFLGTCPKFPISTWLEHGCVGYLRK